MLIFPELKPCTFQKENFLEKNSYTSGIKKSEEASNILKKAVSGKRNPEKILYVSINGTFYSYLKKLVKLQVICDKLLSFQ